MKYIFALTLAALLSACGAPETKPETQAAKPETKVAAPDADAQKFPTDFRRASMLVSDIDESLKFYRDILGFQVNYDTIVTMSGKAMPAGEPGAKARLVLVSSNDSWVGWLGFLQWIDPPLASQGPRPERMGIGDIALVFNTEKVDEHCEAAAKLPGITMTQAAGNTTYPGRNGAPDIVVRTCYLFDNDGYFVELNKILDRDSYK